MWKLIRAEMHQFAWAQAASALIALALYGIVTAAARNLPTAAKAAGGSLNYALAMFVCAAPVLLAWTADWSQPRCLRIRLLETLPIARWKLNLARLSGAVLSLWPAIVGSIPLWLLLRSIYGPRPAWLALWSALGMVHVLLFTMLWRGALVVTLAFLTAAAIPLYLIPELDFLVAIPVAWLSTPWPASVLLMEVVALASWILRRTGSGS